MFYNFSTVVIEMGGHRNLEYAFWANEQSFGSAVCEYKYILTLIIEFVLYSNLL